MSSVLISGNVKCFLILTSKKYIQLVFAFNNLLHFNPNVKAEGQNHDCSWMLFFAVIINFYEISQILKIKAFGELFQMLPSHWV